jgi:hypothetical protein
MKKSIYLLLALAAAVLTASLYAATPLKPKQAVEIGKKEIKKQMEQSGRLAMEYDTVIAVPVHSKTVRKNDFYLLYFLKNGYFRAEMAVDRLTGAPTILTLGEISKPYSDAANGIFNYRYFNADSILSMAALRIHLPQDSARLSYFGINQRLGKRGVIWELFSKDGISYLSLDGPTVAPDQLVRDVNLVQLREGNYAADSIRMGEILAEVQRLKLLPEEERGRLKLTPPRFDSLLDACQKEREQLIMKFPDLGKKFPLIEGDSLPPAEGTRKPEGQ